MDCSMSWKSEDVRPFEQSLNRFLDTSHATLLQKIRERKAIDDGNQRATCSELIKEAKESSRLRRDEHPNCMPSLLDIRRRIRSVKNTQQLTKAMKNGFRREAAPRSGPRVQRRAPTRSS